MPYHLPPKSRHEHIHYGAARSKTIEDFKAVSRNVMHSSMKITDRFYSVLDDEAVTNRIASLGRDERSIDDDIKQILLEIRAKLDGRQ